MLLSTLEPVDKAKPHWDNDLGIQYQDRWKKLKLYNQTSSNNVGIQENHFKILNRWHLTPKKLAKMRNWLKCFPK